MGCHLGYNGYLISWTNGKLTRLSKGFLPIGIHDYNYSYNALGQRVGISYTYTPPRSPSSSPVAMGTLLGYSKSYDYDQSGRLISESRTNEYYGELGDSEKIVFLYDEAGMVGFIYTTSGASNTYYYDRNIRGDVIGIYDASGARIVKYSYDAWGNCTIDSSTTNTALAKINPIRYRGYYYDEDIKLYYLNSRYYGPLWRRFLSPDSTSYLDPETPNGLNLYAYCNNDPVNYSDPSGHLAFFIATAIFGAAVGFGLAAYNDYKADGQWFNGNIEDYLVYTLGGAFVGGLLGAGVSGLLTGSFFSSVGAVKAGALLTYNMARTAGITAAGYMMYDNILNSINYTTHIFWSGGDLSMNGGRYLSWYTNGTTLEMTNLGQYLTQHSASYESWKIASINFANQVTTGATVFAMQNIGGVSVNSTWALYEYPILIKKGAQILYELIGGI